MKYPVIFLLAILLFIAGCAKDSVTNDEAVHNEKVESRTSNLVTICHRTGNGQFISIEVNQNAVPAHLAHGDYLPDADGDGYSAIGACTGSMDDCDDDNADVHPGASEICDNGLDDDCDGLTDGDDPDCSDLCVDQDVLNGANEYIFYYDEEENNCLEEEFPIELAVVTDTYIIYAIDFEGVKGFFFGSEEGECVGIVGENITEEQYQYVVSLVRSVIAAHPEMPNYCQGFRQPDQPEDALVQPENVVEKMKKAMPEKIRRQLENK